MSEAKYDPLANPSAVSRRKCLLFAVPVLTTDLELLRQINPELLALNDIPNAINIIERAADGLAKPEEEDEAQESLIQVKESAVMDQDFEIAVYFRDIQYILSRVPRWAPRNARNHYGHVEAARALRPGSLAGHSSLHLDVPQPGRAQSEQMAIAAKSAAYLLFLMDIFGASPPAAFDPSWRTDTALSLARQMYESRDFGAMPILADALQDAGCEDEAILNHCRDAKQVHVRGCWVVDLVLGKT